MNAQFILNMDYLVPFCQKWAIREMAVFGSALRDDFRPDSDLDLLVTFTPEARWDLFDLMDMKCELEEASGRSVDLIEKDALRNPWRKREILKTCEVIYAA
jgi:predicted nucleotidyltransferase